MEGFGTFSNPNEKGGIMPEDSTKSLTEQEVAARALAERIAKLRTMPEVIAYEAKKTAELARHGIQTSDSSAQPRTKPMRQLQKNAIDLSKRLKNPPVRPPTEVETRFLDETPEQG